jgi:hypothetical protein
VGAPANALPFIRTTAAPFPNYANGPGNAVTILNFQVPKGQIAVVRFLAIVHWGGGVVDGQNVVIWRVLVNGAGVDGLENLGAQVGSWAQPNEVQFVLQENDVLTITAESVGAAPAGQTSARIHGFSYPVNTGTAMGPAR